MTINYTNADVRKGSLSVNTGGQDFTVNTTVPVNIGIRNAGDGTINTGPNADVVQDQGSGDLTVNLGGGNDQFFAAKQLGSGVHIDVAGGAGNDFFINAGHAQIDYIYNFNSLNQSGDGNDGIRGFVAGRDHLVLNGITQAEFIANFSVTDAQGSLGVVITDGTGDGWSVQLIGVHEDKAALLADGAFVFTT